MDSRLIVSDQHLKVKDSGFDLLLWNSYDQILEQLEAGCPESAMNFIRDLRFKAESDDTSETLRRLVSVRIAIKTSSISDDGTSLLEKKSSTFWIPGEIAFVIGLVKFHKGFFSEGVLFFKDAAKIFASIDFEARSILSVFNALIGEFYSGQVPDINLRLELLRSLEKRTRTALAMNRFDDSRLKKVLGMILREIAVLFESQQRFYAAIEELGKAIDIFALNGTRSDYQLALIHASDLKLMVGDRQSALKYYDYVLKPVDTRIEFPLAYLEWRLFGKPIIETSFNVLPPTWLERWRRQQQQENSHSASPNEQGRILKWFLHTNQLLENARSWKLKPSSLEGKLLRLLQKNRSSKYLLSEALWPEFAKISELDHRLHQLISRINQKYGSIIIYDGSCYKLSCIIEIEQ